MSEPAAMPRLQEQHVETESTNPFSDSYLERRFRSLEERGSTEPRLSQPLHRSNDGQLLPVEDRAAAQITPLRQLETDDLTCRVLLLPRAVEKFIATRGDWITLSSPLDPDPGTSVKCMAITETAEDVAFEVKSPIRCKIFFDTTQDHVIFMNNDIPIIAEELADQLSNPSQGQTEIEPFGQHALDPGFWRLRTGRGEPLDIRVYPRQYSIVLVRRDDPTPAAGSKRRLTPSEPENTVVQPPAEIVRPLDSPDTLSSGETALVATNTGNYSIFHMRKLSDTRAARLFEARHSSYPDKVIVVKTLRFGPDQSVIYRGITWEREYNIHRQIQSDKIVELLGGDARLRSLYLQKVDACDLTQRGWCNRKGDYYFTGTHEDAARVLVDMATALEYLREKRILHNDIKPSNILYSRRTGAVLIDFGLGTFDDSQVCHGGTPWYVAPEYFAKTKRGAAADVWALGVVMIYLLKRVPLPDSQRQVKLWMIRDVAGPQHGLLSPDRERMMIWQSTIRGVVRNIEQEHLETNGIAMNRVIIRMLEANPEHRLTVAGLTEATS